MNPESDETHYWTPSTNVFVSKTGDLIIKVALSELTFQDLDITVDGNQFRIEGSRRDPEFVSARLHMVTDIPVGPFLKILTVPDEFDCPAARAVYCNGALRIVVPRKTGSFGTFGGRR